MRRKQGLALLQQLKVKICTAVVSGGKKINKNEAPNDEKPPML